MATSNSRFQRRYPPEMRERAMRMVREAIAESGERQGAVSRIARQLGIGPESLRNWIKQADIDHGKRPGVTTAEQRRIKTPPRAMTAVSPTSTNSLICGSRSPPSRST
jgi:transposase-like protein